MTGNVSVDSGQHVVQQYQVRTSIHGTGKSDSSSLTTAQLTHMSMISSGPECDTHRDTLLSYFRHIAVREEGQVWPERAGWRLDVSWGSEYLGGGTYHQGRDCRMFHHNGERTKYYP
jgi:hypothetical protein